MAVSVFPVIRGYYCPISTVFSKMDINIFSLIYWIEARKRFFLFSLVD
jgi:hypothetical protein